MENQSNSNIVFDPNLKDKIYQTAKIAGISAILSLANILLSILSYFIFPTETKIVAKEGFSSENLELAEKGSTFSMIISVLISFVFFYYLYRFARLSKAAIQTDNRTQLYAGLESLSGYFKIIAYVFVLLMIVFIGMFISLAIGAIAK